MVSWIAIPCPILLDLVKGEGTLDQRIRSGCIYATSGWMNPAPTVFCISPSAKPLRATSWAEKATI